MVNYYYFSLGLESGGLGFLEFIDVFLRQVSIVDVVGIRVRLLLPVGC